VSAIKSAALYDIDPTLFGQTRTSSRLRELGTEYEQYNVSIWRQRQICGARAVQAGSISESEHSAVNPATGTAGATAGTAVSHPTLLCRGFAAAVYQCDVRPPYVTQFKVLASYTLRGTSARVVNFQSLPACIGRSLSATTQEIANSPGRPLAGAQSRHDPAYPPFSQFDLGSTRPTSGWRRASKWRTKLQGMFDVYNLTNSSAVCRTTRTGVALATTHVVLNGRLSSLRSTRF